MIVIVSITAIFIVTAEHSLTVLQLFIVFLLLMHQLFRMLNEIYEKVKRKSKKKYFLYRKRGLAKLNTKRNWLKTLHEKRGKSICHKKSLEKLVVISETIANEYFSGKF